jgi:hypothetical protein
VNRLQYEKLGPGRLGERSPEATGLPQAFSKNPFSMASPVAGGASLPGGEQHQPPLSETRPIPLSRFSDRRDVRSTRCALTHCTLVEDLKGRQLLSTFTPTVVKNLVTSASLTFTKIVWSVDTNVAASQAGHIRTSNEVSSTDLNPQPMLPGFMRAI